MIQLRPNITWEQANNLLHSFAAVLTPDRAEIFYRCVARSRRCAPTPESLVRRVFDTLEGLKYGAVGTETKSWCPCCQTHTVAESNMFCCTTCGWDRNV